MLADLSKPKEFVSDPISSSVSAVSSPQAKSDLKPAPQVDRGNNHRAENESKSTDVPKDDSVVSKPAVASILTDKKEDSSLSEVGPSNIESIIPAAPSITIDKPQSASKKDPLPAKKETKPTKIRVKVIQKPSKEKSKRSVVHPPTAKASSSRESSEEKTSLMSSVERQEKMDKFVDALAKVDERQRKKLLEKISKTHFKMAEKFDRLVKKKMAAKSAKTNGSTPSPPPAPRAVSPIVIDDLMDIPEEKSDSAPGPSTSAEPVKTSTVADLDQPANVVDVTDT